MRELREADFSTLVGMLRFWAVHEPEKEALVFLQDGEQAHSLTFRQLDEHARRVGAYLQGIQASGQRALLLYPTSIEYLAALFGCVYAGVVGVLVVPPRPNRPVTYLQKAAEDAGATVALTTSSMRAEIQQQIGQLPGLRMLHWAETDRLPAGVQSANWEVPPIAEDDLAYLIYSSGSTGEPKGVMISHRSLLQAAPGLLKRLGTNFESVFVCWIPLHHIAGLELCIRSLLPGGKVVLMPTDAFLERPLRWLKAITRFRGTFTFSFKFGLQSAMDRITSEERESLDLSSLRVLMVTGERIQATALRRFAETFATQGFRAEAFAPGYGLTECAGVATVPFNSTGLRAISLQLSALEENQVRLLERGDPQGQEFVGCGSAFPDRQVIIVDPQSLVRRMPGEIGEIWIVANGIADGYWDRPEDTASIFRAHLATGEGPYLRTGDLGFFAGDDLVITGRIKDLIILRGRNYYSQDFEQAIQGRHPVLESGSAAAFAIIVNGEEQLVILFEVERDTAELDADEVIAAIRKVAADDFGQPVHTVGLVRSGALPRTASGKIQRYRCRSMLLGGTLDVIKISQLKGGAHQQPETRVGYVAPRTAIERALVEMWCGVLKVECVGVKDNFFTVGGDSLAAIQMVSTIRQHFAVELPLQLLAEAPTVEGLACKLADVLSGQKVSDCIALTRTPESEATTGSSERRERRTGTERRLAAIWERLLGVHPIGTRKSFVDLQGNSDLFDQMVAEIRNEFDVFAEGLPTDAMKSEPTIEALARMIDDSRRLASSLVVPLQPRGSKRPLFLIHAGGGYVFFYRALASHLGPNLPVYGVSAEVGSNGLGGPFHRTKSIEELAARYVTKIKTIQRKGPYSLGGACFGGVVAFEMARQLRLQGDLVESVLLFDAFPWSNPQVSQVGASSTRTGRVPLRRRGAAHLSRAFQLGLGKGGWYVARKVLNKAACEMGIALWPLRLRLRVKSFEIANKVKWMRWRAHGTPVVPEFVQRRLMERAMKTAGRLLSAYAPGVCEGSIVLFKAAKGEGTQEMWTGLARGGMVVHEMSGGHLDMLEEPAVIATAQLVQKYL